jgi:hypothetical protein
VLLRSLLLLRPLLLLPCLLLLIHACIFIHAIHIQVTSWLRAHTALAASGAKAQPPNGGITRHMLQVQHRHGRVTGSVHVRVKR